MPSLYYVLGVPATAADIDIRRAYRKLALRLHPDKNHGAESPEWLLVQSAYEILGVPQLRRDYDVLEGDLNAISAARNRAKHGEPTPNMAEYMANQHEWRRQEARARATRDMKQRTSERQKDTEEFLAEVDRAMKDASDRCRPAESSGAAQRQPKPRQHQEEDDVEFQKLVETLKKRRAEALARSQEEQKRAERQMKEDMDWLHQMWEASIDSTLEQEREEFERERAARQQESEHQQRQHLGKCDDMLAAAKAEMEAIMAQMAL